MLLGSLRTVGHEITPYPQGRGRRSKWDEKMHPIVGDHHAPSIPARREGEELLARYLKIGAT